MADSDQANKAMAMAQQEMDYRVDLFNRYAVHLAAFYSGCLPSTGLHDFSRALWLFYRMVSSCFEKCVDKRYERSVQLKYESVFNCCKVPSYPVLTCNASGTKRES